MIESRRSWETTSRPLIQQLMSVPFPQMVQKFAEAILAAQNALDENSLAMIETMADPVEELGTTRGRPVSMLDLGLVPSFYHFTHGSLEVRFSVTVRRSTDAGIAVPKTRQQMPTPGFGVAAAPVGPAVANKYNYPAGDCSSVSARLVSVPVPSTLSERLRQLRKRK